jgi:hypothetical protein
MMIMICHGDDEGDVDGCRKCNSDSFGEGCCDSDDDVDCKCDGNVDVEGYGDGDVFGCGHGDGYGFMMNVFFYLMMSLIYLIPTIVMSDVFNFDDKAFMFFVI